MKATVLGGRGFIGSALAAALDKDGIDCWVPARGESLARCDLGVIFYCIGITADFRSRPLDTVEAHVSLLQLLLRDARWERLVYLSSSRVYKRTKESGEDIALSVQPADPDDLYDISKIMGESLVLSAGRDTVVARVSNVIGPGMGDTNFLGSVLAEAKRNGHVLMRSGPRSEKDYIWIDDVVAGLRAIADKGTSPIYNLASGSNCTNAQIASIFADVGVKVETEKGAPESVFSPISIDKLVRETGFSPSPVLPRLSEWIASELQG